MWWFPLALFVPWSAVNRRKWMVIPGDGPVSLFECIHIYIHWSGGTGAAFLSFFIDIPNEEIYFGANEPRMGSISLRLLNSLHTSHRPYQCLVWFCLVLLTIELHFCLGYRLWCLNLSCTSPYSLLSKACQLCDYNYVLQFDLSWLSESPMSYGIDLSLLI